MIYTYFNRTQYDFFKIINFRAYNPHELCNIEISKFWMMRRVTFMVSWVQTQCISVNIYHRFEKNLLPHSSGFWKWGRMWVQTKIFPEWRQQDPPKGLTNIYPIIWYHIQDDHSLYTSGRTSILGFRKGVSIFLRNIFVNVSISNNLSKISIEKCSPYGTK